MRNVWRFLHMMTNGQFLKPARDLETLQLGSVVTIHQRGKPTYVFVKKPPVEAMPILAVNADLCSLDYYESRYNQTVSKSITLGVRHELVVKKLISAKQVT